jgi:hypothetical protein
MAVLATRMVAPERITGDASLEQYLFAIENRFNSGRLVRVRRLSVMLDATAALNAVMPQVKAVRGSGVVTNGRTVVEGRFDTTQTVSPNINAYVASRPDDGPGGVMSVTAPTINWQQIVSRNHTLAEQMRNVGGESVLPALVEGFSYKIYPGQYMAMRVNGSAITSNPITNFWVINCVFTEEDLDSFTISGVVTLSAVPVVGAEVLVVVADDVAMTNAYFHSIQVTGAGGTWSAQIPNGKLGFAYAQNDVSGTKYTSPGRPYQA